MAKEIFQDDSRGTVCLCFCPYLCLDLFLLSCRLVDNDLVRPRSYQLGQYRANVNDGGRVDRGCGSSEACSLRGLERISVDPSSEYHA